MRPTGSGIAGWLLHLHGPVAYILIGLLVFAEAGLVVGVFIPGEVSAVVGGVLAAFGQVNVEVMVAVVVLCAVTGYPVGYQIGKLAGPWLLEHRPLRGNAGVAKSQRLLERFGGPAVLVGRFMPIVRALIPGLAGFARLSYPTFLLFDILGGAIWGSLWVLLGNAAGASYQRLLARAGTWSFVALAVVVLALVALHVFRHVHERRRTHGAV